MPRRILIVEDDPALGPTLVKFLERKGYLCDLATDLSGALSRLDDPLPDLTLTDVRLPDGSGLEVLDELRRRGVGLPVLVMTGLEDLDLAAEAMKGGAVDFLTKPFDHEVLLAAVRSVLPGSPTAGADAPAGSGAAAGVGDVTDSVAAAADPALEAPATGGAGGGRAVPPPRLIGYDPRMIEVFKLIGMAAHGSSPVLIRGETGTGKELVARAVHRHSRSGRPFVAVNCSAMPDTLLESELFGHEKGAFTGAVQARRGYFELARDGTLLLDEIGDTSPQFQGKILRVLQEGEFTPIGSERPRRLHARILAATHRPLERMLQDGTFRADLYYRIRVIEMNLPPLRERDQDFPALARYLLERAALEFGRAPPELSPAALEVLLEHDWPGNVRELDNVLRRAIAGTRARVLGRDDVSIGGPTIDLPAPSEDLTLDDVIQAHVNRVLEACDGNKREAARRLGISPGRLYRILDGEDR
jgi:DNA-binding NtrC family response regulator